MIVGCGEGATDPDLEGLLGSWSYIHTACQPGDMVYPAQRLPYVLGLDFLAARSAQLRRGAEAVPVGVVVNNPTPSSSPGRELDLTFGSPPFLAGELPQADGQVAFRAWGVGSDTLTLGRRPDGATDGCWHAFVR